MNDESKARWSDYRPSKAMWFWSCVAAVILTMVIGFTWGGWVTGGTLERDVAEARETARAELAATICVARFTDAPDVAVELAALKDESSWSRDDIIADAGWATPRGLEEPVDGAADLCAERLVALELPVEQAVDVPAEPVVAQ
jgi:hypothetical protein